jgi:hypothetical protein
VRGDAQPIGAEALVAALQNLALRLHATHEYALARLAAHGPRDHLPYAIRDGRICRLHGSRSLGLASTAACGVGSPDPPHCGARGVAAGVGQSADRVGRTGLAHLPATR